MFFRQLTSCLPPIGHGAYPCFSRLIYNNSAAERLLLVPSDELTDSDVLVYNCYDRVTEQEGV